MLKVTGPWCSYQTPAVLSLPHMRQLAQTQRVLHQAAASSKAKQRQISGIQGEHIHLVQHCCHSGPFPA